MDVVGSEIGQKMRSAIKAKLTELGCYVDDELPDYVMVMVANKRTRAQMEEDLQLFLGDNTESFVNWLHQVLKKLQEVTIAAPLLQTEVDKSKERSKSKEKKSKVKKDKSKKDKTKQEAVKKSKKKSKEKALRKKEEKKLHKSKKKSKHHELIRPNVPPLLMNIEKESEPSITDVFAGQILKNHGITIESPKEIEIIEEKPIVKETKRPILPIIDPATMSSHTEIKEVDLNIQNTTSEPGTVDPVRDEQIKEITEIETKIQGLKQKLVEQLDSISDDEDFLNIRTEAEELMNDFAEDVFQEISQPPPVTPPPQPKKTITPPKEIPEPPQIIQKPEETLPQIELRLPKRPVRDRLGFREEQKKIEEKEKEKTQKKSGSPERFTPEREPDVRAQTKSAKSRLGEPLDSKRKSSHSEDSDQETHSKRLTSRVSVLESRSSRCASIVRVRPRPRVAPNSSLLLKAMADAHKSLLNIPPKVDAEPSMIKRALVHPMRRCVDASHIVIQVQGDRHNTDTSDTISLGEDDEDKLAKSVSDDLDKKEYAPGLLKKVITNTEYVPPNRRDRTASCKDDKLIIETINIHNPTLDRDKTTQFIVTMDGFNPNAFLAKKLMTEGLLEENEVLASPKHKTESVLKIKENDNKGSKVHTNAVLATVVPEKVQTTPAIQNKRLSDTSEESDTQVIIKNDNENDHQPLIAVEKRRTVEIGKAMKNRSESNVEVKSVENTNDLTVQSDFNDNRKEVDTLKRMTEVKSELAKKRKASPIVFDFNKKEDSKRERTESASSDNIVTVTTVATTKKYDTLPPLDKAAVVQKPASVWCRSFPQCRYGSACAFAHPRCKFAAACTRRGCVYSHALPSTTLAQPAISSQVVPAANFKTISPGALPSLCKFYPSCVNPTCHYYHPKLCRYGKNCMNKLECNFYHNDKPSGQFEYPG